MLFGISARVEMFNKVISPASLLRFSPNGAASCTLPTPGCVGGGGRHFYYDIQRPTDPLRRAAGAMNVIAR